MIIGLTGKAGTGKTCLAQHVSETLHLRCIELDKVGHACLEDESLIRALVKAFGKNILLDDKRVSRPKLGGIVFQDSEALKVLNHLIHPMIAKKTKALLVKNKHVIIEGALIQEIGIPCDKLVCILADPDLIEQFSGKKKRYIASIQASSSFYKANADAVLSNQGSLDELKKKGLYIVSNWLQAYT